MWSWKQQWQRFRRTGPGRPDFGLPVAKRRGPGGPAEVAGFRSVSGNRVCPVMAPAREPDG